MQLHSHPDHNDASDVITAEVLDRFYAPVQYDALTELACEFERTKRRIIEVQEMITTERVSGVMGYFFSGNARDSHGSPASLRHASSFEEIFTLEGALNDLTATYWQRALDHTNLMEIMPQERRSQWHKSLNGWRERGYKKGVNPEQDMPEFNLDNLRSTLQALMARRAEFVAERVDGIFRALSRVHVTNCPEAFNKRMIMNAMYNDWGSTDWDRLGFIHDLRVVIAKFMGRDEPERSSTERIMQLARSHTGEWFECDAGSLRVRAYKVGTAHLDIHPEMAWRLNGILAYLYPAAIPDSSCRPLKRTRKGTSFKERPLFDRPISNAVISLLNGAETYSTLEKSTSFRREYDRKEVRNSLVIRNRETISKHLFAELSTIMAALGGVQVSCGKHTHMKYWQFDYDPIDVVHLVVAQGFLPDQKSFQFYPTPDSVAQQALVMADLTNDDIVLEPSAGQGGIADYLPRDRTLCVEISPLHCQILKSKGHNAIEADFLNWAPGTDFSAIIMNPPYSEGRWQAHTVKAASHLCIGGRLVAVLPTTARAKAYDLLPGFELEFSSTIDNAFDGTGISVVLMKATRQA
ncbi:DUF4942 domain-containing protein [Pseudomonas saliphila]|uniref:DUF4942 domain-containing protein n=1 Tax=Pseudomonas saliphila TaxID=2586906 RepID=UPI0015B40CE5|nr:DUF4942 domain-containing protein [Pseudomonas saliphila]